MERFRSQSYNKFGFHLENSSSVADFPSANPSRVQDLRCYSTSYASSGQQLDIVAVPQPWELKKGRSTNGASSRNWGFIDPEIQRKKRVASYKAYTVEGNVKRSLKNSLRWIKEAYSQVVYGRR